MQVVDTSIDVLHVDDDPAILRLTADQLERLREEFTIETTTDPEGIEDRISDFDVLLTDYKMPSRDGLSVIEAVRERDATVPIVMYTGEGDEEVASRAISAGVDEYVEKGTGTQQYEALCTAIERAVGRYRSRRQVRALVDALDTATDGVAVLDRDRRHRHVTAQYAELFGYDDPDALVGEPLRDLFEHADGEAANAEDIPALDQNGDWCGSVEARRPDGSTVECELSLSTLDDDRLVCTVRRADPRSEATTAPATARDDAPGGHREAVLEPLTTLMEDLMAAESRTCVADHVRTTLEGLLDHDVVCVRLQSHDAEHLLPVSTSESAADVMGERPVVDHGQWIVGRVAERGATMVVDDFDDVGFEIGPVGAGRSGLYTPIGDHGTITVVDTERAAFDDHDRRVVELLAAQAESVLDRYEQDRVLERRGSHIEELTSVLSHDLKNLLNVATGRTALAATETNGSDHLQAVENALERMDAVIDDVLTLARQGDRINEWSHVDLAAAVETVWETAGDSAARLTIADELGTVACDRSGLQQLLENLIRNAIHHAGPDVEITVRPLDDGFAIADDGPGIPPDERERVFESGYTSDPDGTGFGLSIVESIVDAHAWTITITESRDGGARFEIRDADVHREEGEPHPVAEAPTQQVSMD